MLSIYLAGPDVFWPNAAELGAAKKALCQQYGFIGHFPLDSELDIEGIPAYQAGLEIYQANIGLMDNSDIVIANMTPFRGPSMDVGTAFEMGYMAALNKVIWGYSLDGQLYSNRIDGDVTDSEGYLIESFNMADNLMMIGATECQGGLVTQSLEQTLDNHLLVFEKVLQQL